MLLISACGREEEEVVVRRGGDNSGAPKSTWGDIKELVSGECVLCHNGTKHPLNLATEEVWKASNSKARIANASMPPNKKLEAGVKDKLLSYF